MNPLWWVCLLMEMEEEDEEEDEDNSFSTGFTLPVCHKETRWDRFCKRHPVIDRVWPDVFGILLGLTPLFIGYILPKLLGIF